MYATVKIVNSSEMTRSKPYEMLDGVLYVSQDIYTHLGSLVKNFTVERHEIPRTKFEEFMLDMDNTELGTFEPDLENLDLWLGELGVTEEFPISRFSSGEQAKVNARYIRINKEQK